MAYKLFSLSDKGDITINKLEILTIPVFKAILQRDKGSIGDADGRKKLQAFREFAYIYQIADYDSVPNRQGYSVKAKLQYAVNKSGLSKDYVADSLVIDAIKEYELEQSHVALDTIRELIQTFKIFNPLIVKVREALEFHLSTSAATIEASNDILNKIEFIMSAAKKIPKIAKDLNDAINLLKDEVDDTAQEIMRGTTESVPQSADPTKDY